MRNKSVWERACGLTRTIVEGVDFDEHASPSWSRCGRPRRRGTGADVAINGHRVMTLVRVVDGGGRWISGRRKCSSKGMRPEFSAGRTG